jgi:hypothetical protein
VSTKPAAGHDELMNGESFYSLAEAKVLIKARPFVPCLA